ncbi:M15 family metallopeptidase [Bacillus sp. APMAM]|uniref:M15 family metallopeptidase n=1 Tax=Margalitia sp. FSL K6-0131 TaxID=2954604 RepID=UPI000F874935|nr:M15 family metallopeptidase [Bacillus sp. APMAM]RTZ54121.1 D-alanyl-D-alanine carboxypeptidase family protein [Bacillus sp. SAJ1]
MIKKIVTMVLFTLILIISGCSGNAQNKQQKQLTDNISKKEQPSHSNESQLETPTIKVDTNATQSEPGLLTVADPESITVLVDKKYAFPQGYEPKDLVYPNVPFIFNEKIEKRMMRAEAAKYLEKMFHAANEQNIPLAGVSAYRSYQAQTTLFNNYVKKDGIEKAKTYSAVPGTSEHQSGLTIDVSGLDGSCAAEDCFANTKEATWLKNNAHNYGFIIRYPKNKEKITGYQYEPWHIRYVGVNLATELFKQDLTLEEYYHVAPVNSDGK